MGLEVFGEQLELTSDVVEGVVEVRPASIQSEQVGLHYWKTVSHHGTSGFALLTLTVRVWRAADRFLSRVRTPSSFATSAGAAGAAMIYGQ